MNEVKKEQSKTVKYVVAAVIFGLVVGVMFFANSKHEAAEQAASKKEFTDKMFRRNQ